MIGWICSDRLLVITGGAPEENTTADVALGHRRLTGAAAAAADADAAADLWSDAEWKSLQRIVKAKGNHMNWEGRARQLGTGRTGQACRAKWRFMAGSSKHEEDSSDESSEEEPEKVKKAEKAAAPAKQPKRQQQTTSSKGLERTIQIALSSGGKMVLPPAATASSGRGAATLYIASNNEQPQEIAAKLGVSLREILSLNKKEYAGLQGNSELYEGTVLQVPAPKPSAAPVRTEAGRDGSHVTGAASRGCSEPDYRWDRYELRQVIRTKRGGAFVLDRTRALTDKMESAMIECARENDCEEGYTGLELFNIPGLEGKMSDNVSPAPASIRKPAGTRTIASLAHGHARLQSSIRKLSEVPADKRFSLPPLEMFRGKSGGNGPLMKMYRYRHRPGGATGRGISEVDAALLGLVDQLQRAEEVDELEVEKALLCVIDEVVEASTRSSSDDDDDAAGLLPERSFWTHEKGPTADELAEYLWTMWKLPGQPYLLRATNVSSQSFILPVIMDLFLTC